MASTAPPKAAAIELAAVRAENARLRAELARLQGLLPLATTTLPPSTSQTSGERAVYEAVVLLLIFTGMALLCALPLVRPFKRICETRLHKVYPVIAVANMLVFAISLNQLLTVSVNSLFFGVVTLIEVVLVVCDQLLMTLAVVMLLLMLWKFKDRILEALGIENAGIFLGDFRDWATCWSMWRFHPIEIFIWKVEGLPAAKLHTPNDVFCEVSLGYNVEMRTRVHLRAGQSCVFKESVQLNFDPFDLDNRLRITLKNQDVVGSTDLATLQLGAAQVRSLELPALEHSGTFRGSGGSASSSLSKSVWSPDRFQAFDLLPAGQIFLSFSPVPPHDEDGGLWSSCRRPRRPQSSAEAAELC